MNESDRIAALEARIARLELLNDEPPPNILGDWIESTEKFAFQLLLQELERALPSFSVAEFRKQFRDISLKLIDEPLAGPQEPRQEEAMAGLKIAMRSRLEDIIAELIPPSLYD